MHLLILLGALAALLLTAAPAAAASFSGDFNGDGNSDLAVGAPGEDLAGRVAAGQVHVFYGKSDAACFGRAPVFAGARSQAFTQDTTGVPGVARERDRFGAAFAAGDLDRDGFDDLAIGAPGDAGGAGTVLVLRGSPAGLVTSGARLVRQGAGGVPGAEEDGDEFGASLLMPVHTVSVPFLAIGAPGESLGAARNAGAVSVLYAPNANRAPHQLTQDTPGIPGRAETGDGFGGALGERGTTRAAGLSVGAPGEAIGTALGAGNVTVLTATAELGVSPAATPEPVEL